MSKHLEGLLPTTGLEFDDDGAPHGPGKWGLFGLKENGLAYQNHMNYQTNTLKKLVHAKNFLNN